MSETTWKNCRLQPIACGALSALGFRRNSTISRYAEAKSRMKTACFEMLPANKPRHGHSCPTNWDMRCSLRGDFEEY
ncbi:hypothetical protein CDAR_435561 [Caerostris darwini]|uniref:Uncharacterized protein n=1 Tax=Caerostris darwini TaxID=1538125 RepID=A0AAV4VJ18_9ARAC|nr:hypothetical protein CDAR_435561 [Caerostris darwini]